jgi:hypothetical protein
MKASAASPHAFLYDSEAALLVRAMWPVFSAAERARAKKEAAAAGKTQSRPAYVSVIVINQ